MSSNKKITKILLLFILILPLVLLSSCTDDTVTTPMDPVEENHPPNSPSSPVPADSTTITAGSFVILRWNCSDPDAGDTLSYDILLSTSNPPTDYLETGYDSRLRDLGIPGPGTFYWKIVAFDNEGDTTQGPVWQFTVQ